MYPVDFVTKDIKYSFFFMYRLNPCSTPPPSGKVSFSCRYSFSEERVNTETWAITLLPMGSRQMKVQTTVTYLCDLSCTSVTEFPLSSCKEPERNEINVLLGQNRIPFILSKLNAKSMLWDERKEVTNNFSLPNSKLTNLTNLFA